jgi:hypothetical protein
MPNKTIRCILIDDEPLALEVLKSHLSQHQNPRNNWNLFQWT